jgi:hypothetical protein
VTERAARFVDDLRAAEAASAEVLAAWIAVCSLDGLRGGLATIAAREATHAELLAERLAEMHAPRAAAVGSELRAAALGCFGAADVSDEEKLALVLVRYPDDTSAARPIEDILSELGDDPETCEILRLVAAGEAATVAWLRAYRNGLERRAEGRDPRVIPRRL